MAQDIYPDQNPPIPASVTAPSPGDKIKAGTLALAFKALLNGIHGLKKYVDDGFYKKSDGLPSTNGGNADTLDGLDSSQFWKKSDSLPSTNGGNADTLDGLDSSQFWKKSEGVNADTLDGRNSSEFLLASDGVPKITALYYVVDDVSQQGYTPNPVAAQGFRAQGSYPLVRSGDGEQYTITTPIPSTVSLFVTTANYYGSSNYTIEARVFNGFWRILLGWPTSGSPGGLTLILTEL